MEHPDEDALVTAMDGTMLDVMLDREQELVILEADDGRGGFALAPRGAMQLAEQLRIGALIITGDEDAEQV